MKQHIEDVDPDIFGLCGIDAAAGEYQANMSDMLTTMVGLGYRHQYNANTNLQTASAIFYKAGEFEVTDTHFFQTAPDSSEFIMYCVFYKVSDPKFSFVFGESDLRASPIRTGKYNLHSPITHFHFTMRY